jgi:hypothetical protein
MRRYRSSAHRQLEEAVRAARGTCEPAGSGKIRITGPTGSITIYAPGGDTRRDLRRSNAARKIAEKTGLVLGDKR